MSRTNLDVLTEQLEIADQLLAGRSTMFEPQDLPGRYGRAVRDIDRVMHSLGCGAVIGGGWAVWRHGYIGRVTQDIDIVLPADRIEEFLRGALLAGFEDIPVGTGRWPRLWHKETNIQVDILPEGGRPGTAAHPAPTIIPHPARMGATGIGLRYVTLPFLVELKLAAGRARDESDIIELVRVNPDQVDEIRAHLRAAHQQYATAFDRLVARARAQQDQ